MQQEIISIYKEDISLKGSYLKSIMFNGSSLEIIFSRFTDASPEMININFEWLHSFRVTDEGDLLKLQNELKGTLLEGVYQIEGSAYLQWFNDQSYDSHAAENISHYLFVTGNDVIDVLSSIPPIISK